MPRGYPQWPAGLFWPDRQYRLARPGPCGLALDRGDGIGGRERACPHLARGQRAEADAPARGVDRHRGQGIGLRDFLSVVEIELVARISLRSSGLRAMPAPLSRRSSPQPQSEHADKRLLTGSATFR